MGRSLAVRQPKSPVETKRLQPPADYLEAKRPGPEEKEAQKQLSKVQKAYVKLRLKNYTQRQASIVLAKHLYPGDPQRREKAYKKVAQWEQAQWFLDAIWEDAIKWADAQSPSILYGLAKQARRGKVQEAKFLLELTGRYSPDKDKQPAQVNVVIHGIPRPAVEVVDADYSEVTDGP